MRPALPRQCAPLREVSHVRAVGGAARDRLVVVFGVGGGGDDGPPFASEAGGLHGVVCTVWK